jgi:hypothetical protein
MLSGYCLTTYQQQIKNFNSLAVNVSVPTVNTLHGVDPQVQTTDRPLLPGSYSHQHHLNVDQEQTWLP